MSKGEVNKIDEILLSAQMGDEVGIERIIEEYRSLVVAKISRYSGSPLERDDLFQEGMIGLLAAINSYSSDKGASFKTYASICIENSIQSALRKFNRQKDIPTGEIVEYQEEQIPERNGAISAEDTFIAQEGVSLLTKALDENLSDFENKVLRLHIVGCNYNEIAERLCRSPKAVDNAIQRIRKKIHWIGIRPNPKDQQNKE